jgi:hypothetical protein
VAERQWSGRLLSKGGMILLEWTYGGSRRQGRRGNAFSFYRRRIQGDISSSLMSLLSLLPQAPCS